MTTRLDHRWYREEAQRTRERAAAAQDPELRESFVRLALEYDKLADTLEAKSRSPNESAAPKQNAITGTGPGDAQWLKER